MFPSLNNKVAIVTGGSKGIGNATANKLAEAGVNVAICARNFDRLENAANEIEEAHGVRCVPIQADLTERSDTQELINTTIANLDQIDILVNNVGNAPAGTLEELTETDWYDAIDLKLMGHIRCTTEAIPHLIEDGGAVVNVIGNNGVKPIWDELTPNPVNAGGIQFTKALAMQYGRKGVRVNAINPGPVATDRWDQMTETIAEEHGVTFEEAWKLTENSIPLNRICEPEEVANVIVFLASNHASFINGASLNVDGGQQKDLMDFSNIRSACKYFENQNQVGGI